MWKLVWAIIKWIVVDMFVSAVWGWVKKWFK